MEYFTDFEGTMTERPFLQNKIQTMQNSYEPFFAKFSELLAVELREFEDDFLRLKNDYKQILHEFQIENRTLAEDFNIFGILGVSHYEVTTHSTMLRELLDARGTHGQGNLFFLTFLSMLAGKGIIHSDEIPYYSSQTFDDYLCKAELLLETGRVDIVISRSSSDFPFYFIIENKVYAVEQEEQIKRYWQELEKMDMPERNKKIFYLTIDGKVPLSIDTETRKYLEKKGILHYLSYKKNISSWLASSLPKTESEKVRYTIKQYIDTIDNL